MTRRRRRGSVMVEFAFAIPVLVSLFLGVWQFGYVYYLYNTLEHAVRAGARYASIRTYDAGFDDAVKNVVVFGSPSGGDRPVAPHLTKDHVELLKTFSSGGRPSFIRVQVKHYNAGSLWDIYLEGKPSTAFPFVGLYNGS